MLLFNYVRTVVYKKIIISRSTTLVAVKNGVKKVQAVAYNGALPSANSAILPKYPTFEAVFACFHGQKNKKNLSF